MSDEMTLPLKIGAMESGQYAIDDAKGQEITGWIEPEHAAHIVHAVNSHDTLVSALTVARNRLADMLMNGGDDGQAWKEAERAMPEIEAALTAAQGDGK